MKCKQVINNAKNTFGRSKISLKDKCDIAENLYQCNLSETIVEEIVWPMLRDAPVEWNKISMEIQKQVDRETQYYTFIDNLGINN